MSYTAVKPAIPSGILGMLFLLTTEIMFFGGLISAYIVNRAGAGVWPPDGQPRLPVEITALNTFFLVTSAFTLFYAGKAYSSGKKHYYNLLLTSFLLGILFVVIQGVEWIKLLGFGLTTSSSIYGAFFYTIIGVHATHVLAGLILLGYLLTKIKTISSFEVSKTRMMVCSIYWYFVVGIWPLLYVLVYLY